jgi:hypothetical protein
MKIFLDEHKQRATDTGFSSDVLDFYYEMYQEKKEYIAAYKNSCRLATWNLRHAGLLIPPELCSICRKSDSRIECHHPDYTDTVAVIWVCRPCHGGRVTGRTRRRHRATEAYIYLSERVKTDPAYRRFQQAKQELYDIVASMINVSSTDDAIEWLYKRQMAEQKLWKMEWGLKGAFATFATTYDANTDKLY